MFSKLLLIFGIGLVAGAAVSNGEENEILRAIREAEHNRRADQGDPEDPPQNQVAAAMSAKSKFHGGTIPSPNACKNFARDVRKIVRKVQKKLESGTSEQEKLEDFVRSAETILSVLGNYGNEDMGGAVYVRWGRISCPDTDTELVYRGVAGGGGYQQMGGGSDLICLTREPQYSNKTDKMEGHAQIYGAEFEAPQSYFSHRNAPVNKVNGLQDQDIPCAVCRANTRRTQIMIPGRNTCHGEGWTREYWGFLTTNHYNHKGQTTHVCVDEAPQGDPKGAPNNNGALLYVVQGVCGSLPCPPYVNGWELTCVVCTK